VLTDWYRRGTEFVKLTQAKSNTPLAYPRIWGKHSIGSQ
jgi:hypothetical protein